MPNTCHNIRWRKKRANVRFEFSENMNGIKWVFYPPDLHPDAGWDTVPFDTWRRRKEFQKPVLYIDCRPFNQFID
jgi:hypothetical protein